MEVRLTPRKWFCWIHCEERLMVCRRGDTNCSMPYDYADYDDHAKHAAAVAVTCKDTIRRVDLTLSTPLKGKSGGKERAKTTKINPPTPVVIGRF